MLTRLCKWAREAMEPLRSYATGKHTLTLINSFTSSQNNIACLNENYNLIIIAALSSGRKPHKHRNRRIIHVQIRLEVCI